MKKVSGDSIGRPRSGRAFRVMMVVAALSGLGLGMLPEPAHALPATMTEYEYYSDDTFSEFVGYRLANSCYGVVNEVEGQVTAYRIKYTQSCNHASPPKMSFWYCDSITCETDPETGTSCVESHCVLL
jgi:hypothetical protein